MAGVAAATVGSLALALGMAVSAQANLTGSGFEGNDGNLVVDGGQGNTDWGALPSCTTPPTAGVLCLTKGIDQPSGSSDNSFGKGTKEDNSAVTVVSGSIPPNKNDLTRFYEGSEQLTTVGASGKTGDIMLYLAWERLVNLGNANLDFEINQNATSGFTGTFTGPITLNRTAGDLLVTYDFGGSGTPTLGINTWLTSAAGNSVSQCYSDNSLPCWGLHQTLNGTTNNCPNETVPDAVPCAEGAVNTDTVSEPIIGSGATLGAGLFGEASIDLTAAGVFKPGVCEALGSMFAKSRSSSSFTSEIKDFIAPSAISISNCGSITIKKVTQNEPVPGTQSFSYTTSSNLSSSGFTLKNGDSKLFSPLNAGSYTVTEAAQSAPWNFVSLVCDTTETISGQQVTVNLGLGQNVTCTYTNHYTNSPTIATALSATTANIGDSIHDSATLTGASADAGGTVTYHAYAGANTCTGTDLLNSQVTVTKGTVPDSAGFTPAAAGYYSFQAFYSGDGNNNEATSDCTTEQLLVKTNPSITTKLSATTISAGESVSDSATLGGATGDAGGTVTYHAYAGQNTCTGTDLLDSQVTVTNGIVPDSKSIQLDTAGYYSFQAVYSGDAKNNGATSDCTTEQLLVKANPAIATTLSATTVNLGDPVHDSAKLSGVTADAGGTVTYSAYAGQNTCAGTDLLNSTVTVTNGVVPDSAPVSFNASGWYSFQAVYNGDTKNNGAKSDCTTEQLLVKTSPTITTTLSATSVDVGSTVHDSALLSSMTSDASGTVMYTVYTDNACTQGARDAGTVTVTGGVVPDSNGLQFDTAGTYYWQAIYSGDASNNGAKSVCTDETLVVNPLQPSASTAQNVIPNDAFTLGGGFSPSGSITFNLYSPSDTTCTGAPALTQTVDVSGNGTYNTTNTTFVASTEGTWRWASSYTGDINNKPVSSACGVESFTITNK